MRLRRKKACVCLTDYDIENVIFLAKNALATRATTAPYRESLERIAEAALATQERRSKYDWWSLRRWYP